MFYLFIPIIVSTIFLLIRKILYQYPRDTFYIGTESDGRKYMYFGWYGEWGFSLILNLFFLLLFMDAKLLFQHYIILSFVGHFIATYIFNLSNPKDYNPKNEPFNLKGNISSKITSFQQYKKNKEKKELS